MNLVSLPWYDDLKLQAFNDSLWLGLRAILLELRWNEARWGELPKHLTRVPVYDEVLEHPKLLLSQTCGYNLAFNLPRQLQIVCTPNYTAYGCGLGMYSSQIVYRQGLQMREWSDFKGLRLTANDDRSFSGYHCWVRLPLIGELGPDFFSQILISNSHLGSLKRLQSGEADVAAIDSLVIAYLKNYEPELLNQICFWQQTPMAPAPPLVTRADLPVQALEILRESLRIFFLSTASQETRQYLLWNGCIDLRVDDYNIMRKTFSRGLASPVIPQFEPHISAAVDT
jgi:ABC-type phosphate/phosphonate transport system substrate-binding protein